MCCVNVASEKPFVVSVSQFKNENENSSFSNTYTNQVSIIKSKFDISEDKNNGRGEEWASELD